MYVYGQIALTIARAIILAMHTRTNKSTDYSLYYNCTLKCVINYTNIITSVHSHGRLELKLIQ